MSNNDDVSPGYPAEAYAPNGILWWELDYWPKRRNAAQNTKVPFGQEAKLASWLWFNKKLGETFTLPEAKAALGPNLAESTQHFDRRLRTLREVGWAIPSGKDDGEGLRANEYRVDRYGVRWWIKEEREGARRFAPSARVRRLVFERDGRRCVVCYIGGGEPYDGEPGKRARLTIGHRVPQERLRHRGQRDNLENWQTECSRCNEPLRDELADPHSYEEVLVSVRNLDRREKQQLRTWVENGKRARSDLDRAFDLIRTLGTADRAKVLDYLTRF